MMCKFAGLWNKTQLDENKFVKIKFRLILLDLYRSSSKSLTALIQIHRASVLTTSSKNVSQKKLKIDNVCWVLRE